MFRFLDLRIDFRLHRDGYAPDFALFIAGELVVAGTLIAIAIFGAA